MKKLSVCRAAMLLAASIAFTACGTGPMDPPAPVGLVISHEGRLERGAVVRFAAGGATGPVTWSLQPAAAAEWEGAGVARLLSLGPIVITAAAAGATGSLALVVLRPPSLVFTRVVDDNRDVWRMALDGADLERLTTHPAEDALPSTRPGEVFFASGRVAPAAVYSVPAAGGAATRVTTVNGVYGEPVISPDGLRIAFLREVGGLFKVHVADRTGANVRRLTNAPDRAIEVAPAWSPDGAQIAFVTTVSGNADIHVAPAGGGAPATVVSTPAPEVEPAWSPDGQRLVFTRGVAAGSELWTARVADGQLTRLVEHPGSPGRPAWLTDGRVVFAATVAGVRQLHWVESGSPGTVHSAPHAVSVEGRIAQVR